jgi:hypothetical protein
VYGSLEHRASRGDDRGVRLLPSLAREPPPRYVAFVATYLEPLRREAVAALGDDSDADRLYPEVLTDVAMRWSWLELARAGLRRPHAAEGYLRRSLTRRSARLRTQWTPTGEERPEIEFTVWRTGTEPGRSRRPRAALSSGATRLAPYLRPTVRAEYGPVAEAAVAWWHAYEVHRRHRWIALGVVLGVLAALLVGTSG